MLVPFVLVAQIATGGGDVCAAIQRAVTARMGAAAVVRTCEAPPTAGQWIDALPDMGARVGDWSWFTLTGDRTGTRVKALVQVDAPHARVVQPLVRGRIVASGDVAAETGPVTGAKFAQLMTAADVIGARIMRPLTAGAVLQTNDVAIPPMVKAGEPVTAIVHIGAVEVTAAMTALDAGGLGEEIRIAHADRKRVLRGRIVAPGRVEVAYER